MSDHGTLPPPTNPAVTWRESPRFARDLGPHQAPTARVALLEAAEFVSASLLYLAGRTLARLAGGGFNALLPSALDLAVALAVGWGAAFGIQWVFRHAYGHVRVDGRSILVLRLAAAPRGFYLPKAWGTVEPGEFFMNWAWEEVERLAVDSMTLRGREYRVLVATTKDGRSHPIALARRVNLDAVFALAAASGLDRGPE